VLPGGSSPRPPFSRFARRAVTGKARFVHCIALHWSKISIFLHVLESLSNLSSSFVVLRPIDLIDSPNPTLLGLLAAFAPDFEFAIVAVDLAVFGIHPGLP
jgi:hypothetical protein